MKSKLVLIALVLLAAAVQSTGTEQNMDGRQIVESSGPLVIAIAPVISAEEHERVTDQAVAFDDFDYYLPKIKDWCSRAGIGMEVVIGKSVRLIFEKTTPNPIMDLDVPMFGFVFIRPEFEPKILQGVHTDDDLISEACEYFKSISKVDEFCDSKK